MTQITPAQKAQIDYCKIHFAERGTEEKQINALRNLGYAQAAINAALEATK